MAAIVTETSIGEGFIVAFLAESIHLVLDEESGFLNASELCRQVDKKLSRYNALKQKEKLELALSIYSKELNFKTTPNSYLNPRIAGTYFHPALLLDLALWLSPQLYAHSAFIITEIFQRNDRRQSKLAELFRCGETATYENVGIDSPVWRVRYFNLKFMVNERGCFNFSEFCSAYGKLLSNFEKRSDLVPLLEHLRSKGLLYQSYYNPLLFLRLVAWVDLDLYVKCARVIFCCSDERLGALFRRGIAAASTSLPMKVESVVQPDQSPTSSQSPPVELDPPSTSSGQTAFDRLRSMNYTLIDENNSDDDDEDDGENDDEESDSMMDTTDDANNTVSLTEHRITLARERRKLVEEIEREREAKNAALAREQLNATELERVKTEKRLKEEELELVRRQFEDLQVTAEQYHTRLRKLPHRESGAKDPVPITTVLRDNVSVERYECLVLFQSTKGGVHGLRTQLKSTVNAIRKQRDNIVAFVGWFITVNAVETFRLCKDKVEEKAAASGRNVISSSNQMQLDADVDGSEFDLPDACLSTLRIELNVAEADVKILGNLFKKPTFRDDYVAAKDPKIVALLDRVYVWIEDKCAKSSKGKQSKRRLFKTKKNRP